MQPNDGHGDARHLTKAEFDRATPAARWARCRLAWRWTHRQAPRRRFMLGPNLAGEADEVRA